MQEIGLIAKKSKAKLGRVLLSVFCSCLIFVAFLLFFAASWYIKNYGDTGFDSVLFTLLSNVDGMDNSLAISFLVNAFLPALFLSLAAIFLIFFLKLNKEWFFKISYSCKVLVSLFLATVFFIGAGCKVNVFGYVYKLTHLTKLFEESYASPEDAKISFPKEKRNLIYIFLESLETTFLSKEEGGALPVNVMPELTRLAQENINFSHNDGVGGFLAPQGTNWTIAAMVAQTAGIPLKASSGVLENNEYGKEEFLPGAVSITNILSRNGYNQALMVGSNASFANRDIYYKNHEVETIFDLDTAKRDKIVDEDYYVWWGMEDKYLFEYAKKELSEMSKSEKPFAFTLLTVDTHFPDGYACELCQNTYNEPYNNVISCASRQTGEFVDWLKKQSFFENTTVIICGDHPTMDNNYIVRNTTESYKRHVYNCIINSAVKSENYKNRIFTSFDLFPTTLAALGCEIDGERLALGTNLFSDVPTLAEQMGYENFDYQLSLSSNFYIRKFLIGD